MNGPGGVAAAVPSPSPSPSPPTAPAASLVPFGALSASYFGAIGLFNPYAPLWFQSLGLSALAIGLIASLQSWTRVFMPYGWSWLGDHRGRRGRLIRVAAAGALLSALGLLGVRSASAVALVTTLLFVANSGIVPLSEALLAQSLNTPQGLDARRYGRVRMWGSMGFIAAVSAFGLLLQAVGIDAFPAFVAAMNALLLLAAWRLPDSAADRVVHAAPAPAALPLLRSAPVAWFFASVFLTVLAHTSLYTFFSLYLDSLGYGKAAVGLLWAAAVAVEVVFFWGQGRWFGWLTPSRWLLWAAGATALRFGVIAGAGASTPALVAAQALHAVTFAAHHAACIAIVHRLFPDRLRGRGQALYATLGYGVSGVIGGVAGGWLVSAHGFAAVFWAAAASGAAALACAWRCDVLLGAGGTADPRR